MQNEGATLYKKANMDLGDTIDAVEQCETWGGSYPKVLGMISNLEGKMA